MSETGSTGYERPTVERYGSFRELTRIGGCAGSSFLSFGCKGSPSQDLGGGGGQESTSGGGGRS